VSATTDLLGYEPIDAWDALDRECASRLVDHRAHGHSPAWCEAWLQRVIRHAETLPECGVWALAAEIGGWERCAECGQWEHQCTCEDEERDQCADVTDADYRAWHRAIYHCEAEGYA